MKDNVGSKWKWQENRPALSAEPIADSRRDPGRAISDARKCFSYAARERYERSWKCKKLRCRSTVLSGGIIDKNARWHAAWTFTDCASGGRTGNERQGDWNTTGFNRRHAKQACDDRGSIVLSDPFLDLLILSHVSHFLESWKRIFNASFNIFLFL